MRVLVAPDKFKGSLSANEVAQAIAAGVRAANADIEIETCPVADGGEGTLDAIEATNDRVQRVTVLARHPADSSYLGTEFGWKTNGETGDAIIEVAQVIGFRRVSLEQRNPERLSTFGVGEIIQWTLQLEALSLRVALGGSATIDGGVGAAAALGTQFVDGAGNAIPNITGANLGAICSIIPLPDDHPIRLLKPVVLCDVSNPLLGDNGAARVFGPQKGATSEQVEQLEAGLVNLVRVCRKSGIACDPAQPGAGAAGGLGFGLTTFLGATLVPGAPFILDLLRFDERVASADLVITGEGSFDSQTASGKACAEVASRAAKASKPCIVVAGNVDRPLGKRSDMLPGVPLAGVHALTDTGLSAEECIRDAARLLQQTTRDAVLAWLGGKDLPH